MLGFLANLFEEGLGYSSINSAKSALSSVLGLFDSECLGKHPLILKFMRGIYSLRPPAPRYQVTWDANKVLELFLSWPENDTLSLRDLSIKLVCLLALTTAQRVQSLVSIELQNIIWESPIQIVLPSKLKTTSLNRANPVLIVNDFVDKKLCVATCLKEYVSRTSYKNRSKNLLLSYLKPFNPVTTQTVSRWLLNGLARSGVDTTVFKGHSFRHSSTSKASRSGLSVDSILSRVGWSNKCKTFAKFYNRPVDDRNRYGNVVLETSNK